MVGPVDGGNDVSGIILFASPDCKILGNHIEVFERYGVYAFNGSPRAKVVGNTFFQTSGSQASNGFYAADSDDSIIDNNSFEFFNNGIVTEAASTGVIVGNNKYPNTTTPISEVAQGGIVYSLLGKSSEVVTATNVITAVESGKTFYLNLAGGFTSTLPAPAADLKFKFIVTTAPTTAYIITTNSGANLLFGTFLDIVGELTYFSAQDTLNFVASASVVGDVLEVESDGTNWYCVAKSGADGGITVAVT
jgi:hypothetical protein